MKSIFKILFSILKVGAVLLIVAVALIIWGFRQTGPSQCDLGPIASIKTCEVDHSTFVWMNSGWWYMKAQGRPDQVTCDSLREGQKELQLNFDQKNRKYFLVDCAPAIGQGWKGKCYSHSRYSGNGNTKYFELIALDDSCETGIYFKGSKRALINGSVVPVGIERPDLDVNDGSYPEI